MLRDADQQITPKLTLPPPPTYTEFSSFTGNRVYRKVQWNQMNSLILFLCSCICETMILKTVYIRIISIGI
jgi:hypothetical protein